MCRGCRRTREPPACFRAYCPPGLSTMCEDKEETMATPTLGLRHAVLWVSDPPASAEFYADVLGLETKFTSPDAVFMASPASLTDHDLGLFRASPEPARP